MFNTYDVIFILSFESNFTQLKNARLMELFVHCRLFVGSTEGLEDMILCIPNPLEIVQVISKEGRKNKRTSREEQAAKDRSWKIPICYDDDEDNTIAITPVLPIEEPDNSLSMGDKHLDTIPETESDEFIKSSVEDLVPKYQSYDNSSSDDGLFYGEVLDYVDASPPDVEIVSLEMVEIVDPKVGRINDDILFNNSKTISRIVKTLVLAVFHKSFTSSASFWESSIQI
ncbi:hypothetical protein Tco_0559188 [Tanacetum coccineum]